MKNLLNPPYGFDAPEAIKRFAIYSVLMIVAIIVTLIFFPKTIIFMVIISIMIAITITFIFPIVSILIGSLYFKFRERDWLFSNITLHGNENILDVGCGRGLLLIKAAKQLTTGKVYGLDLWVQADQAFNSKEATLQNVKHENVQDKIEIHTGDMQNIPFLDSSMDVVISSWAIHNIYNLNNREKALAEIIRVTKPNGQIAILDIDHAPAYKDYFIKNGLKEVQLLGPRYTFGNKTYLVLAKK